ncbi:MAG TPA: hypothetical protein VE890_13370, partial [Thermoguttaceae bacterium]|nr:hypothetical protein [Thermoguttaceae bacterium]
PPEEPSYRSPEPSEEPAPSEAPESSEVTAEPHTPGTSHDLAVPSPQLVETSAKYGAEVAPSEKVTTGVPARPMVPVITTKATPTADDVEESPELLLSGPLQPEPSSGPSSGSTESVRRLPPVAKVNPVPADHQAVQLPMTPIPIYPTTGF